MEELGGPRPGPSLPVPLHPIVQRPGGNSVAAARWGLHAYVLPPLSPQYAILMTMVLTIFIKYVLHSVDLQSENPWDNKAVYMLYTELFTGERSLGSPGPDEVPSPTSQAL